MGRATKPITIVPTYSCGRCNAQHVGNRPGPGWNQHPKFGHVCSDCDDRLALSDITGLPVDGKRAA